MKRMKDMKASDLHVLHALHGDIYLAYDIQCPIKAKRKAK